MNFDTLLNVGACVLTHPHWKSPNPVMLGLTKLVCKLKIIFFMCL